MNKWIRRTALAVLGLTLLGVGSVFALAHVGDRKAMRRIELQVEPVALRGDAATLERGGYLFRSRGCTECHGTDGAGRDVVRDDASGLLIHAPNITPGPGSAVAGYTAPDWDRAIRHGIARGGRPLLIMPSEDYNRFTNDDFGALVAYLQQMPPVQAGGAEFRLPLVMRALYGAGVIGDAAAKIDHALAPSAPVREAATAEHGAYVANACIGCHGAGLGGGRIPGAPPEWPAAANLTTGEGSALLRYPDARAFASMMRSGKRPDGSAVSPVMPFVALKEINDTDLQALYLHLKSLPPRAAGSR